MVQEGLYFSKLMPCHAFMRWLHTLQMYISIRVLFYWLHIILVFVFVVNFDNVTIGIVSRRVALQNISVITGVFDALREVSGLSRPEVMQVGSDLFVRTRVCEKVGIACARVMDFAP